MALKRDLSFLVPICRKKVLAQEDADLCVAGAMAPWR